MGIDTAGLSQVPPVRPAGSSSDSRTRQASASDIGRLRYLCISARRSARCSCALSATRRTPRSSRANRGSASRPSRFSRKAASVRTASHVSSGGRYSFHCWHLQMVPEARGKKTHQGPGAENSRTLSQRHCASATATPAHSPKPSICFGLSARSSGSPLIVPAKSLARS